MLLFSFQLQAQQNKDELRIDSLSYQYFINADWNSLIKLTEQAQIANIDFKLFQQRLGYAHYVLGNYYQSMTHYTKALKYDSEDEISKSYLALTAYAVGDFDMGKYYSSKLKKETKDYYFLPQNKFFDAVDVEYNYKINNLAIRSNPNYMRLGINISPTYLFDFYQAISSYSQINDGTSNVHQNEYFGLLSYKVLPRTCVRIGYHYVHTGIIDTLFTDTTTNHLLSLNIEQRLNRFAVGIDAAYISGDTAQTQIGLYAGLHLKTKLKPYLRSTVYGIQYKGNTRIVFSQLLGLLATDKLWIQSNVTLGNLDKYVDSNGLYFYNSLDPVTFRVGSSAFYYLSPKITLFFNYTFDKKLIVESYSKYNQHSLSGGLIWKI